jgi:hypothetical protein
MNKTIKKLAKSNDYNYNLLKASEELQELSLVLTQYINKPDRVEIKEIIDEIGDVKIRIKILEKLFNKKSIKERVVFKINKFKTYLKNKEYPGKI